MSQIIKHVLQYHKIVFPTFGCISRFNYLLVIPKMDKATIDGYSSVGYVDAPSSYDPGNPSGPSIKVSSMFEAPASKRIGVDHNECLTRAVNYVS